MATKINCINGSTIELSDQDVKNFRAGLRGELLEQADKDYDVARQVWNMMIDKCPALIARCSGTADVITAVRFAAERDLLISIKGGGHNIAGSAVCEGGLMIDLSQMTAVFVDPVTKKVKVQAGALLGDLDHETQQFGLAVTTGINSTTGIAGLALGGGYGWLSRKFGHTVDNMISVDIVTADGKYKKASATENKELFWAVRGGSGNFGVVTNFEFQAYDVGPSILSGPCVYALNADILKRYRDLEKTMPDEATVWPVIRRVPPFPFLDENDHGRPAIILAMAYIGDLKEGEKVLAPYRNLGEVLGDAVGNNSYVDWQQAFDPLVGPRARNYWKSSDFLELSNDVIDIICSAVETMPSEECELFIAQLSGAAGRVAVDDMAFPHRKTKFTLNIHGRWQAADMDTECLTWVRGLYSQLERHAIGSVYVNFVPEADEERKIGPYGTNQEKLEKLKNKFDPKNLFRTNINIKASTN